MAKQLLDLNTTEFDRPTILIDGEVFELRPPEEFSSRMAVRQRQIGAKRNDYGGDDAKGDFKLRADITDEEFEEFLRLGEENMRLVVVDLPEAVIDKLSLGHVRLIVQTWAQLFKGAIGDDKPVSPTN